MRFRLTVFVVSFVAMLFASMPVQAKEIVISIKSAEAGLYRSPDFESEVIYTATEGDQFVSVTISKDFYLVKEQVTGNFLWVSF